MSAALIQSIEDLLVAANTRLTAEIKAETNPKRLETLLTLAFRARVPRSLSATTSPRPPRAPEPTEPTAPAPSPISNPQSPSPNPTSDIPNPKFLPDLPIEELTTPAIAAITAELAARTKQKDQQPGPCVYATAYLVENNYITHPRSADGTPLPLAGPKLAYPYTPSRLEHAVIAVQTANYSLRLHQQGARLSLAAAARAKAKKQRHTPRESTSEDD